MNNFKGWKNDTQDILDEIEIPWDFHLLEDKIFEDVDGDCRLYLQIQFDDIDNDTGEAGYRAYCRKWYLSPYMTKQEIVRTAWLAYVGAVMHETQEKFKYKGKMIYGPHTDPDVLASIAEIVDVR